MEGIAVAARLATGPIDRSTAQRDDLIVTFPAAAGRRLAVLGGAILLLLGLYLAAIGIAASTAPPVEGLDFGRAVAPFAFAFATLPLIAAAGIFRRHRSAHVLGIIVGGLYGAVFVAQGTRSPSIVALIGLLFLLAAILLLDSFRRRASR
jgi:hypothetical protein